VWPADDREHRFHGSRESAAVVAALILA